MRSRPPPGAGMGGIAGKGQGAACESLRGFRPLVCLKLVFEKG